MGKRTERISLFFSEDEKKELDSLAKKMNMTTPHFCKWCIAKVVDIHKKNKK